MNTSFVSIVIPTYNQEKYIAETVESVINQTYTKLEIIISDDCSTDRTIEILREYEQKDSRIKLLLSDINEGISKNFNKAFDACTGEFTAFLGGDDLMKPTKIEKQVEFLNKNKEYVLCGHNIEMYNDVTKKIEYLHYPANKVTNPLDWCFPSDWFFRKKGKGSAVPSAHLARSEYYLKARYDERLFFKHELLFYLDNYCENPKGKWHIINEVLGTYRVHESNFSMNKINTKTIAEEIRIFAAIATHKHPQLTKTIKNHKNFFFFRELLFSKAVNKHKLKRFKIEAGYLKFLYLQIVRLILKVKNR